MTLSLNMVTSRRGGRNTVARALNIKVNSVPEHADQIRTLSFKQDGRRLVGSAFSSMSIPTRTHASSIDEFDPPFLAGIRKD